MKVYIGKNYDEMSRIAANVLSAQVMMKPDCVLGLATGSTPLPLYRELIEREKAGRIDLSRVRSANLDESKGLSGDHDQSYRYFMNDNLFNHVDIDKDFTFVPDGLAEDAEAECAAYDEIVEGLGFADLQLLGLGNKPIEVDMNDVICKGLTLQGIYGRKMDNWHQMSYMVQGGLDMSKVITHRFHYTEFQKGFDAMISGMSGKVVLDWSK